MAKQLYVRDMESILQKLLGPLYSLVDDWSDYKANFDIYSDDKNWMGANFDDLLIVDVTDDELSIDWGTVNSVHIYIYNNKFDVEDAFLYGNGKKLEGFLNDYSGKEISDVEKFFTDVYNRLDINIDEFDAIYEDNSFMSDFLVKIVGN